MYVFLKHIAQKVLPRQWLIKNGPALRLWLGFAYKGNRFFCNICRSGLSRFVSLNSGDLLCPFCGSLPRHRRLWQVLGEKDWLRRGRILDFSPPVCLHTAFENLTGIEYVSTDFAGEFAARKNYDITNIDVPDASFDLVICYHVLEHVEDDSKAMSELFRVLKKGGLVIVQTPFKDGDIFEDSAIQSPNDRLKYFGQADHVRIYSVNGLRRRLEQAGFDVQIFSWQVPASQSDVRMGLKETEYLLVGEKALRVVD
ncbi:MAG TPA: SAM-dependent methyltransferase [Bacteroidetes bacterium]|nr:SAM-dependent methyltransferase [Bacteroidota bacterium]